MVSTHLYGIRILASSGISPACTCIISRDRLNNTSRLCKGSMLHVSAEGSYLF